MSRAQPAVTLCDICKELQPESTDHVIKLMEKPSKTSDLVQTRPRSISGLADTGESEEKLGAVSRIFL